MEYMPQAYTKDTLVKAFEWLQNQPEKVREMADTPETLVSMYHRAHGGSGKLKPSPAQEALQSSKQFISDLKELAHGLEEFGDTQNNLNKKRPNNSVQYKESPGNELKIEKSKSLPQQQPSSNENKPISVDTNADIKINSLDLKLDTKSLQIINKVQTRFNLSSQQEALRLIISVADEKISQWN